MFRFGPFWGSCGCWAGCCRSGCYHGCFTDFCGLVFDLCGSHRLVGFEAEIGIEVMCPGVRPPDVLSLAEGCGFGPGRAFSSLVSTTTEVSFRPSLVLSGRFNRAPLYSECQ